MHQFNLLTSKRFLPLFCTQFLGAFNDNVFKNAILIWFTYNTAVNAGADVYTIVVLAAGLFVLPFLLLSPLAGQLADKYERSLLCRRIKQLEIVLMLIGTACFLLQSIYGLMFVLFCMGVQSTFFGPVKYSLLPEHLHSTELVSGNGLIEGSTFIAILLGTIYGGLVINIDDGVAIVSATMIAIAVAGYVASCYIPSAVISDPDTAVNINIISGIRGIISQARADRVVWWCVLGISWLWLVGSVFLAQLPLYVKNLIYGDETVVTLFLAVFTMGIGIGATSCNIMLRGNIKLSLVSPGLAGMAVCTLAVVMTSVIHESNVSQHLVAADAELVTVIEFFASGWTSYGIAASLMLVAVSAGIYSVPLYAMVQHRSAVSHLSRIIAANNMLNAMFMVIAALVMVALFKLGLSIIDMLLVLGVLNAVICMTTYFKKVGRYE